MIRIDSITIYALYDFIHYINLILLFLFEKKQVYGGKFMVYDLFCFFYHRS